MQLSWLISGPRDEEIIGAFKIQDRIILVGNTDSVALAGSRGARTKGGIDVFVRQVNIFGGPESTTYIGGSGDDRAISAYLTLAGNLYIVGETNSRDLPTFVNQDPPLPGPLAPRGPFQAAYGGGDSDGFVAKVLLQAGGSQFLTYLGGSGADRLTGVAANLAGIVTVCGETTSVDFPTKQPLQEKLGGRSDAVITTLRDDGAAVLFSTYWGGSAEDRAATVAMGVFVTDIVIAGETRSADFPVKSPLQAKSAGSRDLFISKLDFNKPDVIFSTYLGGSDDDRAASALIELDDTIVVAGTTSSKDFPLAKPIYGTFLGGAADAVLLKLSPKGDALQFSSYWGGSGDDEACCLAMHRFGDVFLSGTTSSPDLPLLEPLQNRLAGGRDVFMVHLTAGLVPQMSTYFGGPQNDRARGLSYDNSLSVAGFTEGGSFPVTSDSPDPPAGGVEGFAVKVLPTTIFLPNLSMSRILQRQLDFEVGTLPADANELTISSSDPSRLVLSLDATKIGTTSVKIPAQFPRPFVYMQPLQNSGTVSYTMRASDSVSRQAEITLLPASFFLNAQFGVFGVGGGFRATLIDQVPLTVRPYVPARLGATILFGSESIRPGVEPIAIELRLSDSAVGAVTPSTVLIDPEHSVAASVFQPKGSGVTTISLATPPEFPVLPTSGLEATVVLPRIQIPDLQLGRDQQQEVRVANSDRSSGTFEATLTSGNPNCLLLSSDQKDPGKPVLKLQRQGSFFRSFYAQSLCDSGTTKLTAEIEGWERTEATITFLPRAIVFLKGGTSAMPVSDTHQALVYLAGILPSTGELRTLGGLRPGASPVTANLQVDRTDIATFVKSTVGFSPGGAPYDFAVIRPLKAGEFVLSVTPPEGFIDSPDSKSKLTVQDPKLSISVAPRIGRNLQASGSVTVNYPAPKDGYRVKVVSSDPSRVLISGDRNRAGSQQAMVSIGAGSLGGTTSDFYVQALQSDGQASITATVDGLPEVTATVVIDPSGFVLDTATRSPSINSSEAIQVWAADLDPLSGHPVAIQELRPGYGPVSVELRTSNPAIGVLQNVPAEMPPVFGRPTPQFRPVKAGETKILVVQPPGFAIPASETTKRIIVR